MFLIFSKFCVVILFKPFFPSTNYFSSDDVKDCEIVCLNELSHFLEKLSRLKNFEREIRISICSFRIKSNWRSSNLIAPWKSRDGIHGEMQLLQCAFLQLLSSYLGFSRSGQHVFWFSPKTCTVEARYKNHIGTRDFYSYNGRSSWRAWPIIPTMVSFNIYFVSIMNSTMPFWHLKNTWILTFEKMLDIE